jgi:hypothetical protein
MESPSSSLDVGTSMRNTDVLFSSSSVKKRKRTAVAFPSLQHFIDYRIFS